jgi:ferredoxin
LVAFQKLPTFAPTNTETHTEMAIIITDDCINCGACEPECPNNAIYEGGVEWKFSDGTTLKGQVQLLKSQTKFSEQLLDAEDYQAPISDNYYYIAPDKCTECVGFHEEPQCAAVCPVDCCVPDPDLVENKTELLAKQAFLHKK